MKQVVDIELESRPIVIIGAGRSGTNMLRDILCKLPGLGTWPCDEINYIWRYGNSGVSTDALRVAHARPEVKRYIRKAFVDIARAQGISTVVEKTCANTLRVPFVDAVLPDAVYIHILRDGRDVVASAMKRWTADIEWGYILQKARYVPLADIPYYAARYLRDRVYRLGSDEKRLAFWGPRFAGWKEASASLSLVELSALQWKECVEKASCALAELPGKRVHTIHYEQFVTSPVSEMESICEFLSLDASPDQLKQLTAGVSASSVGNWCTELSPEQQKVVEGMLADTLIAHGYKLALEHAV